MDYKNWPLYGPEVAPPEDLGHRASYKTRPPFPRIAPGTPRLKSTLYFDQLAGFHAIWLTAHFPGLDRIESHVREWRREGLRQIVREHIERDEGE